VNTEASARLAAEQLPTDVQQTWLRLRDLPIGPFNGHPHRRADCWPVADSLRHAARSHGFRTWNVRNEAYG
jgi:hypothetical protein